MRILFCGDSPTVDTGFGIVARQMLLRLSKMGHEIVVLGINFFGEPYDQRIFPFPIYPVDRGSIEAMYGYNKLWSIYNTVKPDILFFLNDPWIIEEYLSRKPDNAPPSKVIAYYPTDSGPIKKPWVEMLNGLDAQICYSNYAKSVVRESNGGKLPKNLYQIYHGVDTKTFFPINQQTARGMAGIPNDEFIVGMVARNQYRKRFDIFLRGFAEFAKDKPKAKAYLHTALIDVGWDISEMIEQLGLKGRVYTTDGIRPDHGVSEQNLNIIYNTFDVNVLLSLGDGFGLPVAESMATGCPQLVSGHSCLQELVEGHGGLTVKTASWLMNLNGINTWGGLPDVDHFVQQLEILYKSQELRIQYAQDGYKFITQEKFTWDFATAELDKIFRKQFHLLERNQNVITESTVANASAA